MLHSNLLFIGTTEIILIVLALLLLFGGKKIPELARGLGKSVKEFKKAQNEAGEDFIIEEEHEAKPSKKAKAPVKKIETEKKTTVKKEAKPAAKKVSTKSAVKKTPAKKSVKKAKKEQNAS